MSVVLSTGRLLGSMAADVVEGSRLVSTQLSIGMQEGYTTRAATLRAARVAARTASAVQPTAPAVQPAAPAVARQNKVAVSRS